LTWTTESLESMVGGLVARRLRLDTIDRDADLGVFGLDSFEAISLVAEIEQQVGIEIDYFLMFEFSTVATFSAFLLAELSRTR
jgi:acyl carrier protein